MPKDMSAHSGNCLMMMRMYNCAMILFLRQDLLFQKTFTVLETSNNVAVGYIVACFDALGNAALIPIYV